MRYTIFTLGTLALTTACNQPSPPMAGGPCSYETSVITAIVTEVDEDGALFEGDDGEFWVSDEYLGSLPKEGDTLTLKRERIMEGTCTPEIYAVVDADTSDQD